MESSIFDLVEPGKPGGNYREVKKEERKGASSLNLLNRYCNWIFWIVDCLSISGRKFNWPVIFLEFDFDLISSPRILA